MDCTRLLTTLLKREGSYTASSCVANGVKAPLSCWGAPGLVRLDIVTVHDLSLNVVSDVNCNVSFNNAIHEFI